MNVHDLLTPTGIIQLGTMPNLRKLIIPDPGYDIVDMDLDRADLQIVVWEAEDADLKLALRENLDMHLFNANDIWNLKIPIDELKNEHRNYPEHIAKFGPFRKKAKIGVHATNYGVQDRTLASSLGITVRESGDFRKRWFEAHPGILKWHKRVETGLATNRRVYNAFGYYRYYFDRIDSVFTKALAWTPQSTVAIVINKALVNITNNLPAVQLLMQVHDSLTFQVPSGQRSRLLEEVRKESLIKIPYADPLYIPVGFKHSSVSWGDCK